MQSSSTIRLTSLCIAFGFLAASSGPAQGQLLDRLRGRETRTRTDEQPIQRNYVAPGQGERVDQYREGRVYRGGAEGRRGPEYRGEAEFRGDRAQTRGGSSARKGTTLIGSTVSLEDGRTMGRIEDFVIGESGCIDFMVVSVSGVRGMNGRLAMLPYAIADVDFGRRVATIDWSEEDLRRAPIFFSSTSWPDFSDSRRTDEIFAFFEVDSHDRHTGRAYREPRDTDQGRVGKRASRDRDIDREDDRSNRRQDVRDREDSQRSSRDRDSYDRDDDRDHSNYRSRSRDVREEDDEQRDERSSRSRESSSKKDLPD